MSLSKQWPVAQGQLPDDSYYQLRPQFIPSCELCQIWPVAGKLVYAVKSLLYKLDDLNWGLRTYLKDQVWW